MAYKITITYAGVSPADANLVAPICRLFVPNNSYIDTPAYNGSVYDTHVAGFGAITPMDPFASTSFPFPVPLAQFKVATVGTNNTVEFEVETYMEAFWYTQAGITLADQGFKVTVAEVPAA